MNATLFNPATGFFGRTYKGRQMPLKVLEEHQELSTEEGDWVVFYTRSEALDTKAVIEVIVIEHDIQKNIRRAIGVGHAVMPLFYDELPITAEICKGSPREVMKNAGDPTIQP
jgi:hypothetical protein